MANAIKKTPDSNGIFHYVINVNASSYVVADWEHDPDVTTVTNAGISRNHWKYDGTNVVVEMSQAEKDSVDLLTTNATLVNSQDATNLYSFTETFNAGEVKTITLPIALSDTFIDIFDPASTVLSNETLLSASGSGPTGWDPTNRSSLENNINDGNTSNLVYNNSSSGATVGYIVGIDMLTPTTINAVKFWDHGTTYFNTSWEFIGTNDSTASSYTVITSGTQIVPGQPHVDTFADETYRYYGVRCVTSNHATWAIMTEIELNSGTVNIVEENITNKGSFNIYKLNDTTFELTNIQTMPLTVKIVIIGKP